MSSNDTNHGTRRRKLMIAAMVAGISLALLMHWSSKQSNPLRALMPQQQESQAQLSEEELLGFARRLQSAGAKLMGAAQCGWTRKQREVFGSGPARRVLESMYVECVTPDTCPGVKAYPTWTLGDQHFPGFVPAAGLAQFTSKLESLPPVVEVKTEPRVVEVKTEPPIDDKKELLELLQAHSRQLAAMQTQMEALAKGSKTKLPRLPQRHTAPVVLDDTSEDEAPVEDATSENEGPPRAKKKLSI
mmetsp:Transcript_18989/g.33753  ORF Transcript_18989/g.33753 Transcript_18989/m.33753 type:complete len:245 (+) Transcript_18989:1487-2221(+)